jgi:hypothetical protein
VLAALAVMMAAVTTVAACSQQTPATGSVQSGISYQYMFAAGSDTAANIAGAARWGVAVKGPFQDSTVSCLSEQTDFDLLDAGGHVLYSGVFVTPDQSVTVPDVGGENQIQWGLVKTGAGAIDPAGDEATTVFAAFSTDCLGGP